ncbi:PIN domain-containing protein [uncultured Maricaulis sp.]|uniref:PIN domain-containing protein n=1 Tax=uncultured Maricaulis sp. TaxID=174710 RepID=UPI0030DAC86F|tara:strand:- start:82757 stop:83179 length:423 start_codon:yes stop_codon:yes gene_type:complete
MNAPARIERVFLDTNVLVYLVSTDARKAEIASTLLHNSGYNRSISTQVLSEFVNVARRRSGLGWSEIRFLLGTFREACAVEQVGEIDIELALAIAQSHRFSWYACLIVAVAIRCGATILLTEDLQHGQVIGRLTIRNPFR